MTPSDAAKCGNQEIRDGAAGYPPVAGASGGSAADEADEAEDYPGGDELAEEEEEADWPESWRRPRRDSLAGLLEQDGMRQVEIWLRDEDRPYAEVKGLIKTEFGIETSEAALCRYYQHYLAPVVVARRLVEANRQWSDQPSESLENAVMARARQLSYDEMMKREPDVRRVRHLLAMVNGMERRQLARERVKLERRRIEQRKPEPLSLAKYFLQQVRYRQLKARLDAGDPDLAPELEAKVALFEDYKQQVKAEVRAAHVAGQAVVLPEVPREIAREGEIERRAAVKAGVEWPDSVRRDPEIAREPGIPLEPEAPAPARAAAPRASNAANAANAARGAQPAKPEGAAAAAGAREGGAGRADGDGPRAEAGRREGEADGREVESST